MTTGTDGSAPVLVVDLDGTLLKSDLLLESLLVYVVPAPWRFFEVVSWLLKGGRAHLKADLAKRVVLDGTIFPWNQDLLERCRKAAQAGIKVVIATASNEDAACKLTAHFPFISRVIGSDETKNLKASLKAERLVSEFGSGGFDYIGDSSADLPVWRVCRKAWFCGSESRRQALQGTLGGELYKLPENKASGISSFFKAVRPHQWLKNTLVFVPMLAAHHWKTPEYWLKVAPVFLALCCMASASYVLNDLSDLNADRRHPTKKHRPFASGSAGILSGFLLALVLFLCGTALGFLCGSMTLWGVILYFFFSILYSLLVKNIPVFDVVFLAALYTYRILLGGIASTVFVSPWLLAFSTTFFLGLAFLKRYVELYGFAEGQAGSVPGRGYAKSDLSLVLVSGVSSSFLSVVVLALYLDSSASRTLYQSPQWLWGIGLIMLFWIIRIWFLAGRKKMDDDPVWFAAKDPMTYVLLLICIVFLGAACPV